MLHPNLSWFSVLRNPNILNRFRLEGRARNPTSRTRRYPFPWNYFWWGPKVIIFSSSWLESGPSGSLGPDSNCTEYLELWISALDPSSSIEVSDWKFRSVLCNFPHDILTAHPLWVPTRVTQEAQLRAIFRLQFQFATFIRCSLVRRKSPIAFEASKLRFSSMILKVDDTVNTESTEWNKAICP